MNLGTLEPSINDTPTESLQKIATILFDTYGEPANPIFGTARPGPNDSEGVLLVKINELFYANF